MSQARARGLSPIVGLALLLALTAALAAGVGATALSLDPGTAPPTVAIEGAADAATDRVTLVHRGGDPLPVASLRVHLAVGGEPLRHQPPVPFVGARGFRGAPTGPFNAASDDQWTAGERAGLRLAGTNDPTLSSGAAVRVEVYVDGHQVAVVETTA